MANAANRQHVQAAATREKAARKAELDAIRFLMREPLGRRFAQRVLDLTGADRQAPFQPNAMVLAHDHGTQSLGYWLLDEIRAACPEQELVMRRETLTLAQRADLQESHDHDERDHESD